MRDLRTLTVWRKAHELTLAVYDHSRGFPAEERYGLTSQLRRSVSSVPTNIAEGCGRSSDADLARFLGIAAGSASEAEYLFLLAHDLAYLSAEDYAQLASRVVEIKKMLAAFMAKLAADR